MKEIACGLDVVPSDDWKRILGPGRSAEPPVLFMGHSAFLGHPMHDDTIPYFMPAKVLLTHLVPVGDPAGAMKLADALNHEMQEFQ
jgi:hypothetical protein